MADYATANDVREALADSIQATTTKYDALLGKLVTRASRLLDGLTGRPADAYKATVSSAAYFDGNGATLIALGQEAVSVSLVEQSLDGGTTWTAWAATDWFKQPYVSPPYWGLSANVMGAYGYFPSGVKNIRVTAVWGYSATPPEPIVQATIIQAARWFRRGQTAFGDAFANADLGKVFVTGQLDPDVKTIVTDAGLLRVNL